LCIFDRNTACALLWASIRKHRTSVCSIRVTLALITQLTRFLPDLSFVKVTFFSFKLISTLLGNTLRFSFSSITLLPKF
jgi:hypothetical protein